VEYFRGLFPSSVIGGRSMRVNPPLGVASNCSVGSSFTPLFIAQNSPTSGVRLYIGDVLGAALGYWVRVACIGSDFR
jgi:hypothetical protein